MIKEQKKNQWKEVSPGLYSYNYNKNSIDKPSVKVSTDKIAKTKEVQPGLYEVILD